MGTSTENVLIDAHGRPVLIDFGDLGIGPTALDPITLELSLLFHASGPARATSWPRPNRLADWGDIDAYADGSPFPGFIRACREWALEFETERGVAALAYAHAMRQFKYPDVDKDLAAMLAKAAVGIL